MFQCYFGNEFTLLRIFPYYMDEKNYSVSPINTIALRRGNTDIEVTSVQNNYNFYIG